MEVVRWAYNGTPQDKVNVEQHRTFIMACSLCNAGNSRRVNMAVVVWGVWGTLKVGKIS